MGSISGIGTGSAAPTRAWAISLALAGLALLPGAASPKPASVSLDLEITQLRSTKGVLRICLTPDPRQFPDCSSGEHAVKRTIPAASPHLRFEGLLPGDYAIAVVHDANNNARLDTMLGVPREGFGFSRNPAIRFGPPSFSSARFSVGTSAETQQVRIKYLL